jgi:phosphoribosylamine--glycine ligase
MKVLVIGSGGREHALCWKIFESKRVDKLYAVPGNGGISQIAECLDIKPEDIDGLLKFAKENNIDLTVVGPEAPLVLGIVDRFKKEGLKIFGPDKAVAQLEGSKVFAKEVMAKFNIPTAGFKIFDNAKEAKEYIDKKGTPVVIKADGLCAGKGVVVAQTKDEALSSIDAIMTQRRFGSAGDRVIIEDCLAGEEASIILVSDGRDFVTFASSQDHKRVFDNDKGPNTGGMGAYSPAPCVTAVVEKKIEDKIIRPIIEGLAKSGTPYRGVLYIGLMIVKGEPFVLEFNVRFGDPETQAILPRLRSDLVDIIEASIDGSLRQIRPRWDSGSCVSVVCASGGYPDDYKKGFVIHGLDKASKMDDVIIFHAGTKLTSNEQRDTRYGTNGGRILSVTALGKDIESAIGRVYKACALISFEGMHYRKDIGYRALKTQN